MNQKIISWPTPEDYEDWQQKVMTSAEQDTFILCLYNYAYNVVPNSKEFKKLGLMLNEDDKREVVLKAIYKHADSFDIEFALGDGRAHLFTIVKNTAIDLSKKSSYRHQNEKSVEDLKPINFDDDNAYDYFDKYLNKDAYNETVKNNDDFEFLRKLLRKYEKLSSYKWKDSFLIYIEIIFSYGENISVTQVYQIAKDDYGLTIGSSTFSEHIRLGFEQFRKWIILGEDQIFIKDILKNLGKESGE